MRGKGLMIGLEFATALPCVEDSMEPARTMNKGLFCQLITILLFKEHKILRQVAGHASLTVKLLLPLILTDEDCDWIVRAFDAVIADAHRVPGAVWSLGKIMAAHAMKARDSWSASIALSQ